VQGGGPLIRPAVRACTLTVSGPAGIVQAVRLLHQIDGGPVAQSRWPARASAPCIPRRVKADKSIIADLSAKTEVKAFCLLSRKQAALYQQTVDELAHQLEGAEGIEGKESFLRFCLRSNKSAASKPRREAAVRGG
jgi:hypothetical protein